MTVEVFGSVEIVDKCGDGSLMRQLLLCFFDSIATWVTLNIALPIRLGIEQGVQRLLDAAPHHPLEVALDSLVVNRDDVESTSSSARFGTASPTLLRERFCTSFVRGRRTFFVLRRLVFEPPRFDVASEAASLAGEVTAAIGRMVNLVRDRLKTRRPWLMLLAPLPRQPLQKRPTVQWDMEVLH